MVNVLSVQLPKLFFKTTLTIASREGKNSRAKSEDLPLAVHNIHAFGGKAEKTKPPAFFLYFIFRKQSRKNF
jgi:hypothetical protein